MATYMRGATGGNFGFKPDEFQKLDPVDPKKPELGCRAIVNGQRVRVFDLEAMERARHRAEMRGLVYGAHTTSDE